MITKTFAAVAALVLAIAVGVVATTEDDANGQTRATKTGRATAPSPTSKPLAHKRGPIEGGELEIYDLHRHGKLVTLDFGMRYTGTRTATVEDELSRTGIDSDVGGVFLVDNKNHKKYLVAGYGGECVCSTWLQRFWVRSGQTQHLSATYGAPPPEVTGMDVQVPHVGTFGDVRIR